MPLKVSDHQRLRVRPIARSIEETRRALASMHSNTPGYKDLKEALVGQLKALMKTDHVFGEAMVRVMCDQVADGCVEMSTAMLQEAMKPGGAVAQMKREEAKARRQKTATVTQMRRSA